MIIDDYNNNEGVDNSHIHYCYHTIAMLIIKSVFSIQHIVKKGYSAMGVLKPYQYIVHVSISLMCDQLQGFIIK